MGGRAGWEQGWFEGCLVPAWLQASGLECSEVDHGDINEGQGDQAPGLRTRAMRCAADAKATAAADG